MTTLHLVRHGRPMKVEPTPAVLWELDPDGLTEVTSLRPELPRPAYWVSSAEPKAMTTARLLTDGPIRVDPGLGEQRRGGWVDDFETVLGMAFAQPDEPAAPGWEPLADTRTRVLRVVRRLLADGPADLVLVGHATAWTVLVAELTGTPADLAAWSGWRMPGVRRVEA